MWPGGWRHSLRATVPYGCPRSASVQPCSTVGEVLRRPSGTPTPPRGVGLGAASVCAAPVGHRGEQGTRIGRKAPQSPTGPASHPPLPLPMGLASSRLQGLYYCYYCASLALLVCVYLIQPDHTIPAFSCPRGIQNRQRGAQAYWAVGLTSRG